MPSAQPGSNSRGRGGKFRKFTRGGGKKYSRNLRPLDADGNEISMWSEGAKKEGDEEEDEEDEDEDDDSEEDSDEDSDEAGPSKAGDASRSDRKQDKKARKDAAIAKKKAQAVQVGDLPSSDEDEDDEDDDMPANPNHSKASRSQTRVTADPAVDEAAAGVKTLSVANRKERESLEAAQAKERYRKLHEQGKTDEAKADMARLRLIREQREAEAARRQAEKEEREAQEKARKEAIDAKEAKKREAALGPSKTSKKGKKPT